MAFSSAELGETIIKAEEDAAAKCQVINGQDVVLLMGCTGSGKTTVFTYLQGSEFECEGSELKQKGPTQGVKIGNERQSLTRGSQAAAGPNGIFWVDLAGMSDTAGPAAELCGALHCSAVLQAANSVRVGLVVCLDRLAIGNERGKGFIRDVDRVAGLFHHTGVCPRSVGMIVTAKADTLMERSPDSTLESVCKALHDLEEHSSEAQSFCQTEGMQITPAGYTLLRYLRQQCQHACESVQELPEGDDNGLLSSLARDRRSVYPVNVIKGDQRQCLQDFLMNLQPMQKPVDSMSYALPSDCAHQVASKFMQEGVCLCEDIRRRGVQWAAAPEQVAPVVDVLHLASIMVTRQLLPSAVQVQRMLQDALVCQNKKATSEIEEGSVSGNISQVDIALESLRVMEEVRESLKLRIPSLRLDGWSSPKCAEMEGTQKLRQEFAKLLPEDIAEVHWGPKLAQQVLGLLQASHKLGSTGSAFCREWAEKLTDLLRSLKVRAAECSSATCVVRVLTQLNELRQFLTPVTDLLALPPETSPSTTFEGAKSAVLGQLGKLSHALQQAPRLTADANNHELLRELCKSSELKEMLDMELEETFLIKPLAGVLLPSQEEINRICERLAKDSSDQWSASIEHLVQGVRDAGEYGWRAVEVAHLDFAALLDAVVARVQDEEAKVQKALARLLPPHVFASAASVCSDWEEEEEEEDKAETATQTLQLLLPTDSLLQLFRRSTTQSAQIALCSVAWKLQKGLKSMLKKTKRATPTLGHPDMLEGSALEAMKQLRGCLSLANSIEEPLNSAGCSSLQLIMKEAEGFLLEQVDKAKGQWAKAEPGGHGWLQDFVEHMQQAKQIEVLAKEEVSQAYSQLEKKVTAWRDTQLAKAREAAAKDESWQEFIDIAVTVGLEFEESDLRKFLNLRRQDFRELVNAQVYAWIAKVEAGPKLATPVDLERLRSVATALERLEGHAREDSRTLKLQAALSKPLERLEATLSTSEQRSQQALDTESYLEACQWSGGLQDSQSFNAGLRKAMRRSATQTLELLGSNADAEVMKTAAERAYSLIESCENIQSQFPQVAAAAHVRELQGKLAAELERRKEEVGEQLQGALEGRGGLSWPLAVLAALGNVSKRAVGEEALKTFVRSQRARLPTMSLHQLLTWFMRQNSVRHRSSVPMPEEFDSPEQYEDLVSDFVKQLMVLIQADQEKADRLLDCKEWGEAKQASEQLREVFESTVDLDILKDAKMQLKRLRKRLSVGNASLLDAAKEEMRRGSFYRAIRTLALGGDDEVEHKLCAAIHSSLSGHMDPTSGEEADVSRNLSVLDSFLKEVGNHPPDELRSLVREAVEVSRRLRPFVDKAGVAALHECLAAASAEETELFRTMKALSRLQHFASTVGEDQKAQLEAALAEFFGRIRRVIEKVAQDMMDLDLPSFNLNIDPMRGWLQASSQLSREECTLLLKRLGSDSSQSQDLKEWVRQSLTSALQALCDQATLRQEAQSAHISRISLRCQIADKLHGLIEGPRVDLTFLKDIARRQLNGGISSLMSSGGMANFNAHFKNLTVLTTELPQLKEAADSWQELQGVLRSTVLDPLAEKLRAASSVDEVVAAILELRGLANEAPDIHSEVMSYLKAGLLEVDRKPALGNKAINVISGHLGQKPLGQQILGEFRDVFGTARDRLTNIAFRRWGEVDKTEELISRLTSESKLGGQEWWQLKYALDCHDETLARSKNDLFFQGKTLDAIKEEVRQELKLAVSHLTASGLATKPESGRALLSQLAMCYSVVKCGQEFAATHDEEIWVAPHRTQMLTVFRLLQAHKNGQTSEGGWWSWVLSAVNWSSDAGQGGSSANHMAQVLTGEGKCLTLALVAAFLALQGVQSDIVCYRKILTEQDSQAMRPFLSFVGVEDLVRYVTFDELCRERLESIQHACSNLLAGELGTGTWQCRSNSERALLIDELDVFFSRRFVGKTWDGGVKLRSPEAVDMVEYVFEQYRLGSKPGNLAGNQHYKELMASVPEELHDAIASAVDALLDNIETWSTPPPVLDKETGRIGYTGKEDVDYSECQPNKTVFAYLSYVLDGTLSRTQVAEHIGIDLVCGRFAFADLPKEYKIIMGVTGTLTELATIPGIQGLLREEYHFSHITITPSIFGNSRLLFKPAEHVSVLDNRSDWLACIEAEVADQKKRDNAVLVFFKNESQLRSYPHWNQLEILTECTDPRRRAGYIAAATSPGRVTLLTRSYGRGIDFQMPEKHEVVVLQTYLSSTVSEETQLKGRTARQGKTGLYKLILCAEHLKEKMSFQDNDVQILKSGCGEAIRRLIRQKQQEKTESKIKDLQERKGKAAQLGEDTRAWVSLLFDPLASTPIKLRKLVALNGQTRSSVHYTVLLDKSGSMGGQPWRELTEAFNSFRAQLLQDARAASTTRVSVSLFNTRASTVTEQAKPAEVRDIEHQQTGGETSFAAAFAEAHRLIGGSGSRVKEAILFLTDGVAQVPTREIKALLNDYRHRIKRLTCIALGAKASVPCLQQIMDLFNQAGDCNVRLLTATSKEELIEQFVEAASNTAVHL